ncbi:MAG: hypothetical protein ACRDV4_01400 [Acidimicrobiales bacterium]
MGFFDELPPIEAYPEPAGGGSWDIPLGLIGTGADRLGRCGAVGWRWVPAAAFEHPSTSDQPNEAALLDALYSATRMAAF